MSTEATTPALLTDEHVGAMLNVDVGTVRYLHRMRLLTGVKCGKHLRWKPATVQKYVETLQES